MGLLGQKIWATATLVLIGLMSSAQDQPKLTETISLYNNEPAWKKVYGIKNRFLTLVDQVTEYQTPDAVNAADGKEQYTKNVAFKGNTITEISDEHKPSYRLKTIYVLGKNNKLISQEIFDDNLDGKGWQFNEKFLYSYEVDNEGNYYNEVRKSTDPRPGSEEPRPRKVNAFYNTKKQLVKYIELGYTYEFSYNEKGDIVLERSYGDGQDSKSETAYRYVYDAKGNWIKRETFRTNAYKDHLLEEVVKRKITY